MAASTWAGNLPRRTPCPKSSSAIDGGDPTDDPKVHPVTPPPGVVHPLPASSPASRTRRIFVRDLVLPCLIGVHRHERDGRQRVRINLDLEVSEGEAPRRDRLGDVVCYEALVDGVRRVVGAGHVNLVETLAESIAEVCLRDPRVRWTRVRIEKLDVFADAASVGVEIERDNAKG